MTHADRFRNHWHKPGWQPGSRSYYWHLTWDGADDLHRLADEYLAALAPIDGLDPIPQRWRHMTLQGLGRAGEVDQDQLDAVIMQAPAVLAGSAPIKVRFDRFLIGAEALLLIPEPAEPIAALRGSLRDLTAEVVGEPPGRPEFLPHVSIAYVNQDGPAAPAVAAVETVRPRPADAMINTVTLVEQHRDHQMYEWQVLATLPLA